MRVFDFSSYKSFVISRVKAMPKEGRGQFQKIARHLRIHTTMVSQIFRGDKNLSLEQAWLLGDYLGLNELEIDYFVALVEKERAGSKRLRELVDKRMEQIRQKAAQISSRIPKSKAMTEETKAIFYSQWYYSAVRLLTSIPAYQDIDAISDYLQLPKATVSRVVDFLVSVGLCTQARDRLEMGERRTHVPADSPLAGRHHANWRLKAMERFARLSADELAFTSPMSLAAKDARLIRDMTVELAERASRLIEPSRPEELWCLNIDWFTVS